MDTLIISGIYIYPIKALAGIQLEESLVQSRGLQYDRRWVLVNEKNQFLHQRIIPELALLQPAISEEHLSITHKHNTDLSINIPLEPIGTLREEVTVWADTCKAVEVSPEANKWFSEVLGISCRLMYMPDDSIRPTDPEYSVNAEDKVSFADGYPILVISDESIAHLNAKVDEVEITQKRFRPNITIQGGHPHIEDELKVFEINGNTFYGVKPCARCIVTTVDPETAEKGREPLSTLTGYRKSERGILFGQNVIPADTGSIKVGDSILVKERLKPIAFSES